MNLRELERNSIRDFVASAAEAGYLSGRVLDYGCGKQPYRLIVEANGGEYVGYDAPTFPASVVTEDTTGDAWSLDFNTVLCTQVVQYVSDVRKFLWDIRIDRFPPTKGGHLVLTYPTNWPEVETADLHRFTKAGMERLLTEAGFEIVAHEPRHRVYMVGAPTDPFCLGYGVIARA